jgi:O-antigen/teichoic acid export membrane protein
MAFGINVALIAAIALPLLVVGSRIISAWIGPAFARQPPLMFPTIVCSFAFLGLNVTAHYALLAVGQVKIVTYLNLFAGIVMLLGMAIIIPRYGLQGAALARLVYGPITCLAYWYLYRFIWRGEPHMGLPRTAIYKVAATGTD